MNIYRRWMMMVLLAMGTLAFVGCNATKDMPTMKTPEGHDATMGGGTGSGTVGDDPSQPGIEVP